MSRDTPGEKYEPCLLLGGVFDGRIQMIRRDASEIVLPVRRTDSPSKVNELYFEQIIYVRVPMRMNAAAYRFRWDRIFVLSDWKSSPLENPKHYETVMQFLKDTMER